MLKQINPEYLLEELLLEAEAPVSMQRADSLEKTLILGKIEGKRRWRQAMENEMIEWHH